MAAGSDNNIVKIMLILSDRKQVFDVPSDIDAQELLKKAKVSFQSSNLEFEEGKNHGKLSLKNMDKLGLKISSNEKKDPDGDSDKNYPVCGAAFGLKSEPQASEGTPIGSLAAYMPRNAFWKGEGGKKKKKLRVFFFHCKESDLMKWEYYYIGDLISPGIVMFIITKYWNNRFAQVKNGDEVPRFEYVDNVDDADIRVEFRGDGGSWSKLGSEAGIVSKDKPTMVLSFHDKKNPHQIRATIVHEFGHVLGLGHEHQHPNYWNVIKKFVNMDYMRESLGLGKEKFNEQWASVTSRSPDTHYDEESVMHYPTKREWLKDKKYQSQASIDKLHHDKELSDEHYKMLSGFLRHVDFVSDRPSEQDVKKVVNAYTEENMKLAGSTSKITGSIPETSKAATIDFSKIKEKKPTQALLILVKNGESSYQLLSKVALKWHDIASVLKLKDIPNIKANRMYDDTDRADHVFNEWFNDAPNLCEGKYPVTWKGLYGLLDDAGLAQIANDFFDTLGKK